MRRRTKRYWFTQISTSAIGAFLLVVIGGAVLVLLVKIGYGNPWTGFGSYTNSKGELVDAKRLWDWLELIIIPAVLSLVAFFLNRTAKRTEQIKLQEQLEEDRLKDYFNSVTDLIRSDNELKAGSRLRYVAVARTISALRSISSPARTSTIIGFLRQTGLLAANTTTHSLGLLVGAKLQGVNLSGTELVNASLEAADFSDCLLIDADLSYSDLSGAVLAGADLTNGDLVGARLDNADLSSARLTNVLAYQTSFKGTTCRAAIFDEALFLECDFSNARNLDANQFVRTRSLWGCKFDSRVADELVETFPDRCKTLFKKPDFFENVQPHPRGTLPDIRRAIGNQRGVR